MKVLFLGNMNNNHYRLVKGLRRKGIDVYLWIFNYDYYLPEHVDEGLKNGYPNWIKTVNWGDPFSFYGINNHHDKYKILLNNFDLVITLHYGLYFLEKFGFKGKTAFLPSGPDLIYFPFYINRFRNLKKQFFPKKIYSITKLHRETIKKCDYQIVINERYSRKALDKLGVPNKKRIPLGIYIDTNDVKRLLKSIKRKEREEDYIKIFSPSRIILHQELTNDQHLLLEAVKSLPQNFRKRVKISFIEKGSVNTLKKYVDMYNLANQVEFIPFMTHFELYQKIVDSDIIFATMCNWGIYGSASLEAFICGKPTIQPIDKNYSDLFFSLKRPKPPTLNVLTANELKEEILNYIKNPSIYIKMGEDAAEWIEKYHGEGLLAKYIKFFEMVAADNVDIENLAFN